jgi:uncharacterized membrane protein
MRKIYSFVAVGLALLALLYALPSMSGALKRYPADGNLDWLGARCLMQKVNPYSPEGLRFIQRPTYGHPPTTSLWFVPFLSIDIAQISLPLGILTLLLLLLHALILTAELQLPAPVASGILGFALIAATVGVREHLHLAQVSEWIAFLYLMSWVFLRRKEETAAGVMMGLACTLKLFPGLMVVFLALTRRWRAAGAAVATYACAALIVTARFGVRSWWDFLALQRPVADEWMGKMLNGSLHGIVLRWFAPACQTVVGVRTVTTTAIILAISVALVWGAWWLTRSQLRRSEIDLPFALASLLSVFLNPWVWQHYAVFLMLPIAVGVATLRRLRSRPKMVAMAAVIVVAAALLAVDNSLEAFEMRRLVYQRYHQGHLSLHLVEVANWLPMVLLMGVLGWQAWETRGDASTSVVENEDA